MTPKQFDLEVRALDDKIFRLKNWKWDTFTTPIPRATVPDTVQNRLKELVAEIASIRFIVVALANVKIVDPEEATNGADEKDECGELILINEQIV